MSTEELIFTIVIFVLALAYLYKALFKASCQGSCGCGGSKPQKENKKDNIKCCKTN